MTQANIDERDTERAEMEEKDLLASAFSQFSTAANQLRRSYAILKKEVQELNLELDHKNRELHSNLQEKEKVNDYLYNILKSLNVGVMVMDRQLRITTFNRAAESLTGLASESVINKELPHLDELELGQWVLEALENAGAHRRSETEFFTSGPNPSHLTVSLSPLRNKQHEVVGSVVILEDITRLKKLEEQARRTNRLTAMGEIAAKIAHEIRNPLGSIELCASTLRKELNTAHFNLTLIDHVLSGVKDLNNVVSNMLLFTRSPEPSIEEMDLIDVIDDSLRLAHYLFKKNNLKLTTIYEHPSMFIHSDKELLKQLFLNLILNAAQAMPNGGELTVSVSAFEKGTPYREEGDTLNHSWEKGGGDWVEIKIKDTGSGVAEEIREKIFDPFFTVRERGTGLGLAIVHNIAEKLNGAVELESSTENGSIFSVILPREAHPKT